MKNEVIPRSEWEQFLKNFSRQHKGWLAAIEVEHTSGGGALGINYRPIASIRMERSSNALLVVFAADSQGPASLAIPLPSRVVLRRTDTGREEGLEVDSEDGVRTFVRFRSAPLPQEVNGVLM